MSYNYGGNTAARYSDDNSIKPLSNPNYHAAPTDNDMYNERPYQKRKTSKWLTIGLPLLVVIIIAAVVGGVVGSKHHSSSSSAAAAGASGSSGNGSVNPSAAASAKEEVGIFAVSTNAHTDPIYPSTTNSAAFGAPTFLAQAGSNPSLTWNDDPFQPANPSPTEVRPDRPRLIAPAYKWAQLPSFIESDPYMKEWNQTIFEDCATWGAMDPEPYVIDGGLNLSGVLDPARIVKRRIKAFAYCYRMSNNTAWVDRAWQELDNASGQGPTAFGTAPDNWNTQHFLDVAEFTAAFAIGYDWLYDMWTDTQKTAIRTAITSLSLQYGVDVFAQNAGYGWWQTVNGNWNCVCNSGLTMGALAILGDDTTGLAAQILGYTINNAKANCAMAPSPDGTWSETPNYWYFGTLAHSEMAASLESATGSDYDLYTVNPSWNMTGLFHMYVSGQQQMFDYGDSGPNKFSTTANAMFRFANKFNKPEYALFQRDRYDAPEPNAMFWYDPSVAGAWWNDLPLDHYFSDPSDRWASMRASWTDQTSSFIAMKMGNLTGHQTHGDLDVGDFVIDALGVRWAGEYGSGDYDAPDYFDSELQTAERWLYYRTRTEGQNTLVLNYENQLVNTVNECQFGSTGEAQGSSTVYDVPSSSTAFFACDMSTTYNGTNIMRGIRFINGRKQVLLQDDITNSAYPIQWRVQTNATVAVNGASATLTLEGQTLQVEILNPAAGVQFETLQPVRYTTDPPLPAGAVDQQNPGVTVLAITMQPGTYSLQVLWNPQWSGMSASDFVTPPSVPLSSWTVTSHNS